MHESNKYSVENIAVNKCYKNYAGNCIVIYAVEIHFD